MKSYTLQTSPTTKVSTKPEASIRLAFDVGHSSIGWAVLESLEGRNPSVGIRGCGVVTFGSDDCLASKRRDFRRQRRHIRATKRRIERMEKLLVHIGAMTPEQIAAKHQQAGGNASAWLLAARTLRGGRLLSWPELWDVLRWYAHNRGYDGNRRWSDNENNDDEKDTEKEENAKNLMREHNAGTMAETFCLELGIDPDGKGKTSSKKRFKGLNAAFPRAIVEKEVRALLDKHLGKLPQLNTTFIRTLMDDARAIPCPSFKLAKRFDGGLLFGQSIPRFDNRIISVCPVSGGKVCAKTAPEFLLFRWLMLLANVRVVRPAPALTKGEIATIHNKMLAAGAFTAGELKNAVADATGNLANNLDTMLLHPDAAKALILDPVQRLIRSERVHFLWPHLPDRIQKRAKGKWRDGQTLTLRQILAWCDEIGESPTEILQAAHKPEAAKSTNKRKRTPKQADIAEEKDPLDTPLKIDRSSGRAPYSRKILRQAADEILSGLDPRKKCRANDPTGGEDKPKDGILVATDSMMAAALERPLDQLTNNHLVRHRLLILQRLTEDIVADPALCGGDASRIVGVAIEVNSELKELSGKSAQAVAQDLGQRLGNFKSVVKKLEAAGIQNPSPGLIRKARVAEDLGWTCPYTGRTFDPQDLLHPEKWDKDHIIPYSERPSNSLDSLVMTSKAINLAKKNRSAVQFIEEMNLPENRAERDRLGVWTPKQFRDFVNGLESWKGHEDDKRRKRRRKQLLLLPKWEAKDAGFLPRDLTVTSHLARLGALALRRSLAHLAPHQITSLPGSVTGTIRTGWKLLGCLSAANPGVLEPNGNVRTKTEIREITHMHHALDAIVIGLTQHYFPKNGRLWEAMVRRTKQRVSQDNALLLATGLYHTTPDGVVFAKEPPTALCEQIRERLAERRVVQHIPADMGGIGGGKKLEQNQRGIVSDSAGNPIMKGGKIMLRRRDRGKDGKLPLKEKCYTWEKADKLVGLHPSVPGKLQKNRAVLVNDANFGVAILDELDSKGKKRATVERIRIVRWIEIAKQLKALKVENNGKTPRIIRNGQYLYLPKSPKGSKTDYSGLWIVESIKDNSTGVALDILRPDCIKAVNGVDWAGMNKTLSVFIESGMLIHNEIGNSSKFPLTGLPVPFKP